ncbi:hypothetical protein KUCAC02_019174, partial [Chaenocephalus aceratus]
LSPLLCANQSVETNGEALPGSEAAAGAVLSKDTSHLSFSLIPLLLSDPQRALATVSMEGMRGLSR